MALPAQGLNVRRVDADTAVAAMAPKLATAKTDTMGGLVDLADLIQGAECFEVVQDGQPVMHYALKSKTHRYGSEVAVVAAVGDLHGVDLVGSIMPYICRQSAAADAVVLHTKRRGLVKKLAAQGFQIDGFILRKRIEK